MSAEDEPTDTAVAGVLDASALLAFLHQEDGSDVVEEALDAGAAIGVVNLAEVLSKLADAGKDPDAARRELREAEAGDGALVIEGLTDADCVEVARLRPLTRSLGLSLADRACLALARRLAVPALTADRSWADANLDVGVQLIR